MVSSLGTAKPSSSTLLACKHESTSYGWKVKSLRVFSHIESQYKTEYPAATLSRIRGLKVGGDNAGVHQALAVVASQLPIKAKGKDTIHFDQVLKLIARNGSKPELRPYFDRYLTE